MDRKNYLLGKDWFFRCFVLSVVSLTLGICPVFAQDEKEFTLEEVVVTGSRIMRNNNEVGQPHRDR